MTSYDEWVQSGLTRALSWHSTYGFELNNREEAGLFWLVLFLIFVAGLALRDPDLRTSMVGVLRMALSPPLLYLWIVYTFWIILFVLIADQVGIWRTVLTKDTLVWSATAGIVLLGGFTEAGKPGYFRQKFTDVISLVIFIEYFFNLAVFSLWIELLLQPVIVFFVTAPVAARKLGSQKTWQRRSSWFFAILTVVMVAFIGWTLHTSWQTVAWELFSLRVVWPVLLGIWVLVLVFPLAVVGSYEQAFRQLKIYRDEREGLWKAKLGLVLAFRIRLRLIREAEKGGTKDVARADSVCAAYEAAERYKTELVAAKHQEAVD